MGPPVQSVKEEYYLLLSKDELYRLQQQLSPSDSIMEQVRNNIRLIEHPEEYDGWPLPNKEEE